MYTTEDVEAVVPIVRDWASQGLRQDEMLAKARLLRADLPLIEEAIRVVSEEATSDNETGAVYEPAPDLLPWYGGPAESDIHWPALRSRLAQRLGDQTAEGIHKTTESIMKGLRAPKTSSFATRGLVLGYVQSGKTTNFMTLAAKAADRGYKLIVVLSGMTDILRSQTQNRIDTMLIDGSHKWHRLTTETSDFGEHSNAGSLFTNFSQSDGGAMIAVIKKNPARLRRLRDWIVDAGTNAMKLAPMLVIDDEADQASIDVGKDVVSTINGLLRDILQHPKSAYVAYSATPFANFLIDPNNEEDLYPRDFIVPMPKPEGYFGAEQLFGRVDYPEDYGLDVIRSVPEEDIVAVRPPNTAAIDAGWVAGTPDSLRSAVLWFLLATAARRRRVGRAQHSTMLVHTSMLSTVHSELKATLQSLLEELGRSVRSEAFVNSDLAREMESIWSDERTRALTANFQYEVLEWQEVCSAVAGVLADTRIVVDNYKSHDRLSYESTDPATVIVIGGNTLSRGLTLEGLVSSYFVRAASAFDTLLQMGRWFGYRVGYEDLGRIWMPDQQATWFRDLSGVEAQVREQISRYAKEQLTPMQLGVRIRLHPVLAVTAASKMRNARKTSLSFSSTRPQTTILPLDSQTLRKNRGAIETFLKTLASYASSHDFPTATPGTLTRRGYTGVAVKDILDLLSNFSFAADQVSISSELLTKYIRQQVGQNSLQSWRVVIMEGSGETLELPQIGTVRSVVRSRLVGGSELTANIRSLSSDRDRAVGLDAITDQKASASDIDIARQRSLPDEGIVRIYPIDKISEPTRDVTPNTGNTRQALNAADTVFGIMVDFPASKNPEASIGYVIANLPDEEEFEYGSDLEESVASDEISADDEGIRLGAERHGQTR